MRRGEPSTPTTMLSPPSFMGSPRASWRPPHCARVPPTSCKRVLTVDLPHSSKAQSTSDVTWSPLFGALTTARTRHHAVRGSAVPET